MTTPAITDVFTPARVYAAFTLTAEVHRLRGEVARLREALAAYDARVDVLQRANVDRESRGFRPRCDGSSCR